MSSKNNTLTLFILTTSERYAERGYSVIGVLELADELKQLEVFVNVGKPKTYSPKDLAQVLRFNKALFRDGAECDKLLENIASLRLKIDSEIQNDQNARGNKMDSYSQKVNSDKIPLDFVMKTPIFKGFDKVEYKVVVCFDVRDKNVEFWFESPELAEIIQNETERIIKAEITKMVDYVLIEE